MMHLTEEPNGRRVKIQAHMQMGGAGTEIDIQQEANGEIGIRVVTNRGVEHISFSQETHMLIVGRK